MKEEYKGLTVEKVTELLKEAFIDNPPNDQFVVYQGCITHGLIGRSASNLNICGDPKCTSCMEMHNAMQEEGKRTIEIKYNPDEPLKYRGKKPSSKYHH